MHNGCLVWPGFFFVYSPKVLLHVVLPFEMEIFFTVFCSPKIKWCFRWKSSGLIDTLAFWSAKDLLFRVCSLYYLRAVLLMYIQHCIKVSDRCLSVNDAYVSPACCRLPGWIFII